MDPLATHLNDELKILCGCRLQVLKTFSSLGCLPRYPSRSKSGTRLARFLKIKPHFAATESFAVMVPSRLFAMVSLCLIILSLERLYVEHRPKKIDLINLTLHDLNTSPDVRSHDYLIFLSRTFHASGNDPNGFRERVDLQRYVVPPVNVGYIGHTRYRNLIQTRHPT
ncbi:hypothetical protein B0H19DRAFT_1083570 [Mycena capillaripes]|nr:hypothetical protein B0H19DRAFT_1083570 [Mycena capillaripes]